MAQCLQMLAADRSPRCRQRRQVLRQEISWRCLDDHKDDERIDQQQKRQQQQSLRDIAGHRAKKNCSVRALPGVRNGQSLPSISGTLWSLLLITTTPWTIGVNP